MLTSILLVLFTAAAPAGALVAACFCTDSCPMHRDTACHAAAPADHTCCGEPAQAPQQGPAFSTAGMSCACDHSNMPPAPASLNAPQQDQAPVLALVVTPSMACLAPGSTPSAAEAPSPPAEPLYLAQCNFRC